LKDAEKFLEDIYRRWGPDFRGLLVAVALFWCRPVIIGGAVAVGGRYPRGGSSLAMSGECGDGGSTTSFLAVVAGVIGLFFLRIAYEVVKRDDR
jgi:hypothetical protein